MNAARSATATRADQAVPQRALVRLLDDLATLVLRLSANTYTARPLPGVSGSVGEHVRHVLDHVSAFAAARPYGTMTYDRRERGTLVEIDRGAALQAILRLKVVVGAITDEVLDSPVIVASLVERGTEADSARSTLRRELASVVSHTVHHQALMATLLAIAGVSVPDAFGLSPSTPSRPRS
jgi:hypothetical protein